MDVLYSTHPTSPNASVGRSPIQWETTEYPPIWALQKMVSEMHLRINKYKMEKKLTLDSEKHSTKYQDIFWFKSSKEKKNRTCVFQLPIIWLEIFLPLRRKDVNTYVFSNAFFTSIAPVLCKKCTFLYVSPTDIYNIYIYSHTQSSLCLFRYLFTKLDVFLSIY